MIYKIRLFICFLLVAISNCVVSLASPIEKELLQFNNAFTSKLSAYESPNKIYKTIQGEMWLFFDSYLLRISGNSNSKIEYKNLSPNKKTSNSPQHISENASGIYFSLGIDIFNYSISTNQYSKFELELKNNDSIIAIEKDSNDNLWIASFLALNKVDKAGNVKNISFPEQFIDQEVGSPLIYSAELDQSNDLYLGTYSFGLLHFNETIGFASIAPDFKEDNTIETMLFIESKLLIATVNGLYLYEPVQKSLISLFKEKINQHIKVITKDTNSIYFNSKTNLWKTDYNFNSLIEIDLHDLSLKHSNHIEINLLFSDDEDILWLSIDDEGLFSYHPLRNKLRRKKVEFKEEENAQLISIFNEQFTFISNKDSTILPLTKHQLSYPTFSYLAKDQGVYLGSKESIIHIDNNRNETIIPFNNSSLLSGEKITSLVKDKLDRVWVISSETGLRVLELQPTSFSYFDKEINIPHKNIVLTRFVTPLANDHMVFATPQDIFSYNLNTDVVSHMKSFEDINIYVDRFERSDNLIYLFTSNDTVYTFSLLTQELVHLNIPVSNIGCIIEHDDYWLISQTKGNLYKLRDNDLTVYDHNDGIPTGGLNGKTCINRNGGNYFSAFDGVYQLSADINIENSVQPVTLIQSIELKKDKQLYSSLIDSQLSIKEDEFPISFNIASSSYLMEEKNQYQYRFKNKGANWNTFSSLTKRVTFDSLAPNNYLIEFRSSNNDGLWSELVEMKLNVIPPIWLMWWAKIGYILLVFLCAYFYYSQRLKSIQQSAKILENKVKQRTEALNKEKSIVEHLLSLKNQEFANISHEFRTPLTLILGSAAQSLKQELSNEERNRVTVIQRNGYRLLRMVEQLLNLETFRIKSITQKYPQTIGKNIRLITEAFSDLAIEKQLIIKIIKIDDINFEFTIDALEKIILNLLSNAIKYSKPGGVITLESVRTCQNELRISVSDSGIGIPADKLDSVFERYNRVLDENSEQVTGAGIGLALVKSLIETHEGRIEIKSVLGKGTSITIYLPIIGEVNSHQVKRHANDEIIAMELMSLTNQSKAAEKKLDNKNQSTSDKPSLLVIEDNEDMRNYIIESIQDDYHIFIAKNGEEGVNQAISEVPDLIISDVMMPIKDGYQVTHELRSNQITNHIPIILLTARGDRESRLKGWHKKADEYLTKPFDVEELQIRLRSLLDIRNILKRRYSETAFSPAIIEGSTNKTEPAEESETTELQQKFIVHLNKTLEPIYMSSDIAIADIATAAAMSERQLFRKLNSVLDMTPSEYLRRFRLEKSKLLLEQGKTANYTAIEVGFSSQAYFSNCFKAQFGLSPSAYKKQKMN